MGVSVERGFTVLELVVVLALALILAGIALGVSPAVIAFARGESGNQQVAKLLKSARETAISRRRNVEVRFLTSAIELARVDVPGPGTTVLETMPFEGGLGYQKFAGLPDTPDRFGTGTTAAIQIASAAADPVMFTTEGAFVDANGDPVNATLFFGIRSQAGTASALTILGPTATIRAWRWDGAHWRQ